ncbi:MAG: fibro-slime domain-containing protein [Chitinispirillaceae bacterium]|nr:fibro-slime domain-containing protein [Chitinispirillaceae bacterium]
MKKTCSRYAIVCVVSIVMYPIIIPSFVFPVAPPKFPETIYIPVTFYDFHSDSSNPEFEITPSGNPIKYGMVADSLDSERKPTLGNSPYFNRRIDRWFRPWVPGDFIIYNYIDEYAARYRRYDAFPAGTITLNHDTSFKNIVIFDTLEFILVDSIAGTYQFADSAFFPLDGKGFGDEGRRDANRNLHNFSFSMELHWEFTKIPGLSFKFEGDDDVWAFVNGTLRMDLGGIHSRQRDSFNLDLETDLVNDQKYTFDFFYVERHVVDSRILITTNILSPVFTFKLDIYPNDTICPFTVRELRASVSDDISGDRPDIAQNTRWRIIDANGQPDSALKQTTGQSVLFIPEVAYSRVILEGSVYNGKDTMRDTVTIFVEPCEPHKIYIEANPVDTTDTLSLRFPQELQQILITENMISSDGYAVARDISGAYVRLGDSLTTLWSITPDGSSFARAEGEDGKKYHGVVTRTGIEGITFAVAEEPDLLKDSVVVIIAAYYIVRLQLRDSANNPVDTIRMSTDEAGTYFVWGLKSTYVSNPDDSDSWVPTNAKWEPSDSLLFKNAAPKRSQTWIMDPVAPGDGTLTLTNPDDSRTDTLEVPYFIARSPADSVALRLLTKAPRRAGDTLLLEVRIFNSDGLVPGQYCFGAGGDDPNRSRYRDTLGTGGGRHPHPIVTVDSVDTLLNILGQSVYSVDQCFNEGIDTIKVVLFYAPIDIDSMHRISVTLGTNMNARTEPFILLPSYLDSIVITDPAHVPMEPQTLSISGTKSVYPHSEGYDPYGNRIGEFVKTVWKTTGELDPVAPDSAINTFITAENIIEDQQGNVCASARRITDGSLISACIPIAIIGPKKKVASAITQDLDGDGYLDAIELHFDRVVAPSEIADTNFTNIFYNVSINERVTFQPDSLTRSDSMTYVLHFSEVSTRPDCSQTSWILYFDLYGTATIENLQQQATTDGAGPVIWEVVKNVENNKVRVELSEEVKNINGNTLKTSDMPIAAFNVYRAIVDPEGRITFDTITIPILDNILGFDEIHDSTLIFTMSNGQDLSPSHLMNLEVLPPLLQDQKFNEPHLENVMRRVKLVGQVDSLKIAPNPTRADFSHIGPGTVTLKHSDEHWQWARRSEGALIRVTVTLDTTMGASMSAGLKIYDVIGNLVNYAYEADFMYYLKNVCKCLDNQKEASVYILDLYWNGSNRSGMKVSPGIYKVVFYLDYHNSPHHDVKLNALLGIMK